MVAGAIINTGPKITPLTNFKKNICTHIKILYNLT